MRSSILNGAPYSRELEYLMHDQFSWWNTATDGEIIEEVEYIISLYYEAGHDNYECINEDINDYPPKYRKQVKATQDERKEELRELKAVLRFIKKKEAKQ